MVKKTFNTGGLPEGFVELAREVYADEPRWIPENSRALRRSFSDENPWFESGESVALCIPKKARLAAFLTDRAIIDGRRTAFFGYWETLGDEEADRAVFDAAREWARSRGADYLCGPINFSTYSKYRLLISAQDGGYPFVGEPFNPPEYPKILEKLGFSPRSEAITQIAPAKVMAPVWRARHGILDGLTAEGFRFEALAHQTWLDNLPELHGLVDAIFDQNFAYTPLPYAAFEKMCNEAYIRRTDPNTSVIAYGPDGSIAGFFLIYPNYGPLIVQEAGVGRIEVDELCFERHFPLLKQHGKVGGVFKTGAVAPAFRKQGLFSALTISGFKWGEGIYDEWFGALVRTDNPSRRYADADAQDARRYALFGKELSLD